MDPFAPLARQFCTATLKKCADGKLVINEPGRQHEFGLSEHPSANIQLHASRFWRRAVLGGDIGFAESYIDGDWSSDDLSAVVEFFARNIKHLGAKPSAHPLRSMAHRGLHAWRDNSRRGSRSNIMAHYDLGNEFYEIWLDPSMTYSSACYDGADNLSLAQARKYKNLTDIMALERDKHVLEVGCGWGGFAKFAATEIGAKVTAITISPSQFEFAARRIQEEGLGEKIDLRLIDYRDLDGTYDAVASIEMFEAVGERYWPVYFSSLQDRLKPGGRAGLQIITIRDEFFSSYRKSVDFIQRHVFPGGMLPSISSLKSEVERAGLSWHENKGFGLDYARTLAEWRVVFNQRWDEVAKLGFDERFQRFWNYYLSYCEGGFRAGNIDVHQIGLQKV